MRPFGGHGRAHDMRARRCFSESCLSESLLTEASSVINLMLEALQWASKAVMDYNGASGPEGNPTGDVFDYASYNSLGVERAIAMII